MPAVTFYDIIYLLSNMMVIYSKRSVMYVFFTERKTNKKIEVFSFICYFIINTGIYLIIDSPILNLINNVVLFFILTFNYSSDVLKKIIATIAVYSLSMVAEAIIYFGIKFIIGQDGYNIAISRIVFCIVLYFIIIILNSLKNLKLNYKLSNIYIIITFITSSISIYISAVLILIYEKFGEYTEAIIISLGCLMLLNILIIYIYDILNRRKKEELEKRLLEQQNYFYIKQLDVMNQSNDAINFLRHDMKNHFIAIKSIVSHNTELDNYIDNILHSIIFTKDYAKSGNIIVDSILNYKFQEAANKDISIELKLKIPTKLNIQHSDMAVILGNLLDNAIEAASKVSDKKIKVLIYFEKDIFLINITNTYNGIIITENNKYKTSHENKKNHGLGLLSVSHAIEKYNGAINTSHTDFLFSVRVSLYNKI